MREHGKKRMDVVKEARTKWSQQVKGIVGACAAAEGRELAVWAQCARGGAGAVVLFGGGMGMYLGILEDVKRKAYEGFVLS
jgi:hypothetical protein